MRYACGNSNAQMNTSVKDSTDNSSYEENQTVLRTDWVTAKIGCQCSFKANKTHGHGAMLTHQLCVSYLVQ